MKTKGLATKPYEAPNWLQNILVVITLLIILDVSLSYGSIWCKRVSKVIPIGFYEFMDRCDDAVERFWRGE